MSLTVDIHQHVIPEFYWEASNEDGNAEGGINPRRSSLDGAIAYLDEAGIDVAVPSISTPGVHFGDDGAARTLARRVNEYLADIKRDRPDRFGAFADALPRLYWDTASAFSDPVLHMLRSVTGLGDVVFGTDYPYPRDAISIGGLRHIEDTAELDDDERSGVLGASAARLIPRLAMAGLGS